MVAADDTVIDLRGVAKGYSLEPKPWLRLWRQLAGHTDRGPQHHALHDVNLRVRRGEAVGVIGRNGAGKSTLLQLICGVLQPSAGTRLVRGRVAALLELGAGFNPELTGRENVRLNGPLLGLTAHEIDRRLPEIIDFAGIGDYIDQPVRSYSSGMFVRLAFAMATSVEPDILVIDEALSVGDGLFARKSFERIMALKERGATVLLCSHSLFQVESVCSRAVWVHEGRIQFDGPAHQASLEYSDWLTRTEAGVAQGPVPASVMNSASASLVSISRDGLRQDAAGKELPLRSGIDALDIRLHARSNPDIPTPTLGAILQTSDGRSVSSAASWLDGVALSRSADGDLRAVLSFPALPLFKGRYTVSVYVLCERGINVYAHAEQVLGFDVAQDDVHQGLVALPHHWRQGV